MGKNNTNRSSFFRSFTTTTVPEEINNNSDDPLFQKYSRKKLTSRHYTNETTVTGAVDITIYDLIGSRHYYNRFNGVQASLNFRIPPSFSKETHYILEISYGDTKTREQIIFR